jgi:hypothetical protein
MRAKVGWVGRLPEPLPGFVGSPTLSEQIGHLKVDVAFNYRFTFSTDPSERPSSIRRFFVGIPSDCAAEPIARRVS